MGCADPRSVAHLLAVHTTIDCRASGAFGAEMFFKSGKGL